MPQQRKGPSDVADQDNTPNLIYYEVLTCTLDSGLEVLVQIFRRDDGSVRMAQIAFRNETWDAWGKPTQLTSRGTRKPMPGVS